MRAIASAATDTEVVASKQMKVRPPRGGLFIFIDSNVGVVGACFRLPNRATLC